MAGGQRPGLCPIVVLGDSGIFAPLQEIAEKKTVGAMPIEVRQCSEIEDRSAAPGSCSSPNPPSPGIARGAGENPGDGHPDRRRNGRPGGTRGVAVNFVLRDGTVKFEMNDKALKEARIQASSQLLKLAILIDEEKADGGR